jgi:pimeloyl-ACP methyl ester carboxylesterase
VFTLTRLRSLIPRSILGRTALGASLLYAGCVGALWAVHRSLIFPAPKSGLAPTLSGTTMLKLDAEGSDVIALYAPPAAEPAKELRAFARPAKVSVGKGGVVVFFHGNGQELVDLSWLARALMDRGLGILFVEYPGYGVAKGRPSEASIYFAAKRALDELARLGITQDQVTLVGQSLGSGVAMEMARAGYGSKLLLISPFTSMVDMVQRFAPILPVRAIVKDRFDSIGKAKEIKIETVVVHGSKDSLVPAEMGRTLAAEIRNATFVSLDGAGHNDVFASRGLDGTPSQLLEIMVKLAKRGEQNLRPNPLAN